MLTNGIWPFVIGGMQKHSYYLCKYLAQRGITVELYHSSANGQEPNIATVFSADEMRFIQPHFILFPSSDKLPGHYLRSSHRYSELVHDALVSTGPVDIIYAKGLAGWKLLEQKRKGTVFPPVCVNVHGYEYYQPAATIRGKFEQYMLRPAFRFVNEHADRIFSYGGNISKIISTHIPGGAHKIIEIPTGIENEFVVTEASEVHSPRSFVFIGRNERRKGIVELTKAIHRLASREDFEFHFIGDIQPPDLANRTNIFFHGVVKESSVIKKILSECDVLVCPSYAEGMPNVILEGMACGCAIIATNVGAIPVMVDDENGWLIKAGSVSALERAMMKALDIPPSTLKLKKAASIKKVTQNFLWDTIIEKVINAFQLIRKERVLQ